ncbi:hypothetical protein TPY_3588 [Sulfobacillus acidophilus TPY]|nr:hypothetical protein TPY_3588 [Sulfobacillus acidophilus TPY]
MEALNVLHRCPTCGLAIDGWQGRCARCGTPLPTSWWHHCQSCRFEASCGPAKEPKQHC